MRTDRPLLLLPPAAVAVLLAADASCMGPPSALTAKLRVPYIPQLPDQSGVAALAMVETYHGASPDMDGVLQS